MKTIKCLIVDDEELARDVIEEYINRLDFMELEGSCKSAVKALAVLNEKSVDLLFLDIQMPGLTGMQLMRNLSNPPEVIFTTAFTHYALEGFELEALDYLVKPISFERFVKAVNRYFKIHPQPNQPAAAKPETIAEEPFIFVKSDKKMVKVMLNEMVVLESMRNYVIITMTEGRELKTLNSISNIEDKLPERDFLRVHRSFIVALKKIDAYTPTLIQAGEKSIPIGRHYKESVLNILEKNNII
ncbi:LytR/AlgR family response regulator transcription factor [Marinilabilia rubra]|uniref:DNA-binding response regulator n=1 Tax=Marinilabilia rubra TaxID=2162893 RepID=A0A2U2B907_9BACT|nr:LytTR family DNA-binding domain-containing protein [Marinilabilia rubra]PWD99559.1 DNA-binding response regulator [Marinilabilia rubra]